MSFSQLTIVPSATSRSAKGRTFRARLLGYLTADRLWELGTGGSGARPVWFAYFSTVGEATPFQGLVHRRAHRSCRSERSAA